MFSNGDVILWNYEIAESYIPIVIIFFLEKST